MSTASVPPLQDGGPAGADGWSMLRRGSTGLVLPVLLVSKRNVAGCYAAASARAPRNRTTGLDKGRVNCARARCDVPLRPSSGCLRGRSSPCFGMPLPRLSAPHRKYIRRSSALARGASHIKRRNKDLGPRRGQRSQSNLSLLRGLWLDRYIRGGKLAWADCRADRRLRRSNLSTT